MCGKEINTNPFTEKEIKTIRLHNVLLRDTGWRISEEVSKTPGSMGRIPIETPRDSKWGGPIDRETALNLEKLHNYIVEATVISKSKLSVQEWKEVKQLIEQESRKWYLLKLLDKEIKRRDKGDYLAPFDF